MYHTYHALQARSSGPEPACGSVQRHCLCLLAISGSAGWLLEAAWMSVVQKAGDGSPARRVRQHTGLVSELWTVLSPARRTIRGCLMAIIIIPHLRSMPRWLGRPQRLTRRSALPVGRDITKFASLLAVFLNPSTGDSSTALPEDASTAPVRELSVCHCWMVVLRQG
jgi:hypothetical protein